MNFIHKMVEFFTAKAKRNKKYNIFLWGENIVEHALEKKISKSNKLNKLYTNVDFHKIYKFNDTYYDSFKMYKYDMDKLICFAKEKEIDIFICDWSDNTQGVIDAFEAAGIKTIGVNQKWSKIETYKDIGKKFMKLNNILTADFVLIDDLEDFKTNIDKFGFPVVVKANGPASGLGVYICENKREAIQAFENLRSGITFPPQQKIIIEEFIKGTEFVIIALWDGKTLLPFLPMKDYKRLLEDDKGPNTGSMGTYCPFEIPEKYKAVTKQYLKKLERALRKYNVNYKGAIYSALIANDKGVYCLEYNMRVGLTEGPLLAIHMENDVIDVFEAMVNQKLSKLKIKWKKGTAGCINIVSHDYPYTMKQIVEANIESIKNLKSAGIEIFHTYRTIQKDNKLIKNGEIFLCLAKSSEAPIKDIYKQLDNINFYENFTNCRYRQDIGK